VSSPLGELLEKAKGLAPNEKRHPSPQQRELLADLLIGLCELATTKPAKKKVDK
jgi:hypothetical protein